MGGAATWEAPMRISRWTALWLGGIAVLVAVEIGVFTGFITPAGLISSLLTVIVGLVIISVFAFIGAIFLGTLASPPILSGNGLTPLAQGMLRMRQGDR